MFDILMLLAVVCFVIEAFDWAMLDRLQSRVAMGWVGLALMALAFLTNGSSL